MPGVAALLEPLPQRTAAIDQQLRQRLAGSLTYLSGFLRSADWNRDEAMASSAALMTAGPISPWVFGLYATLVQDSSKGHLDIARQKFDLILAELGTPSATRIVALNNPAFGPDYWAAVRVLFDTDPARPFLPVAPTDDECATCAATIDAAFALLGEAVPDFADEIGLLLRVFLLATPAGDAPAQQFGAASTFFLWGAIFVNAKSGISIARMTEVLVHEASHQLLFGLAAGGALSTNDPAARYESPLRRDPRPIEGIFHAAFVATRVHMAMLRILDSGKAPPDQSTAIARIGEANGAAARRGIDLLLRELQPTAIGKEVLDALVAYWQAIPVLQD